jgi:hypothetical protein
MISTVISCTIIVALNFFTKEERTDESKSLIITYIIKHCNKKSLKNLLNFQLLYNFCLLKHDY